MKLCFDDPSAPILDTAYTVEKGHGRLEERWARTSQLLHGYSEFPGLRQAIEGTRAITDLKTGKTNPSVEYGVTSLSPRRADAKTLMLLMRRHWSTENKHNHVRDDSWREDRQVWRRGNGAYTMGVLLSVALNLLRARSPYWTKSSSMTERAEIVDDLLRTPQLILRKAS